EEPGLDRGRSPVSFRIVMSEAASLEDHGAQFGGAAATCVVEVDKRKAGPWHCVLQKRDHRRRRQAMLAAKMQEGADQTVATPSVIIRAARPMAVVDEELEHEIEQLRCFFDIPFKHRLDRSRPG